jgi:hypothetical protein
MAFPKGLTGTLSVIGAATHSEAAGRPAQIDRPAELEEFDVSAALARRRSGIKVTVQSFPWTH